MAINERFAIEGASDIPYVPRFNGAPGQDLAVITNSGPRRLSFFRWGLVPGWAKEDKIGYKMINARAETLLEKPSFSRPMKSRRCLVPADGFYEWRKGPYKQKTPFRITLKDKGIFAMAGLWESWKQADGTPLYTFTIITTTANAFMEGLHHRMPVILDRADEDTWLYSGDMEELKLMLQPCPNEWLRMYEVPKLVNHVQNDGPELIRPATLL